MIINIEGTFLCFHSRAYCLAHEDGAGNTWAINAATEQAALTECVIRLITIKVIRIRS